jgi:hypothetical protein
MSSAPACSAQLATKRSRIDGAAAYSAPQCKKANKGFDDGFQS